jgi:uncharacterized protein (TIGR03382 family)
MTKGLLAGLFLSLVSGVAAPQPATNSTQHQETASCETIAPRHPSTLQHSTFKSLSGDDPVIPVARTLSIKPDDSDAAGATLTLGGCSTTGAANGAGTLAIAVLVLVIGRRRRSLGPA